MLLLVSTTTAAPSERAPDLPVIQRDGRLVQRTGREINLDRRRTCFWSGRARARGTMCRYNKIMYLREKRVVRYPLARAPKNQRENRNETNALAHTRQLRVPNNNVRNLRVLYASRARVMSIKNDHVKKIQNDDQLKKKKNRDVTANDDATASGPRNVRTDDAKRSTDNLAMNRPRDVAQRAGVQPVGPVRKGGGYGPRRDPRPLVVRHRRCAPPAVGSATADPAQDPVTHPSLPNLNRRRATRARSVSHSPAGSVARRRRHSNSLTHARRVPRPTLPSVSAVATWDCRARLWVRAREMSRANVRAAQRRRRRSILFVPSLARQVFADAVRPTPAAHTAAPTRKNRSPTLAPGRSTATTAAHRIGRRLDASRPSSARPPTSPPPPFVRVRV